MEPVTHALTALTLGRAGLKQTTRLALPILVVSSLAADLDWLSRVAGTREFLQGHRTAFHSLAGAAGIALLTAAAFWWLGHKSPAAPVRFWPALGLSAIGAGVHVLLDLTNSYGLKLYWPLRESWTAWDLTSEVDPWILILLLLGLLLPGLFRLVSEEIGARPAARGAQHGAIIALFLLLLYAGGRWGLHERAIELLNSRVYHGQSPLVVGAFPESASPFDWRGVVETDNTLEEVEVPLGPGSSFDPELSRTSFKPAPSPALDAARQSELAREFLQFARFPRAIVEKTAEGYRVELRDLRFSSRLPGSTTLAAIIELNPQYKVINEALRLVPARRR